MPAIIQYPTVVQQAVEQFGPALSAGVLPVCQERRLPKPGNGVSGPQCAVPASGVSGV